MTLFRGNDETQTPRAESDVVEGGQMRDCCGNFVGGCPGDNKCPLSRAIDRVRALEKIVEQMRPIVNLAVKADTVVFDDPGDCCRFKKLAEEYEENIGA